jgi:hypothetical protein
VVTVRVPPKTRAMLKALCLRKRIPMWVMLRLMVVCFIRDLPPRERRKVMQLHRSIP